MSETSRSRFVMHEGRITGEITETPAAIQQDILKLAVSESRYRGNATATAD